MREFAVTTAFQTKECEASCMQTKSGKSMHNIFVYNEPIETLKAK